jgi:predicted nucleotidyltransferase
MPKLRDAVEDWQAGRHQPKLRDMDREQAIAMLRAHEPELKAAGVERLSIFGSVARGDATGNSDVDIVIRLSPEASQGGFAYFGRLDTINRRLEEILGCSVDVVAEPVRKERLRQAIEREAALAF